MHDLSEEHGKMPCSLLIGLLQICYFSVFQCDMQVADVVDARSAEIDEPHGIGIRQRDDGAELSQKLAQQFRFSGQHGGKIGRGVKSGKNAFQ